MGVKFVRVAEDDAVSVIAINPEASAEEDESGAVGPVPSEQGTVEPESAAPQAEQADAEEGNGD
jgi:DNA gyrase subunit A